MSHHNSPPPTETITLTLSRHVAEATLAAVVAHGYRSLRRAARNAPQSTGGRTVAAMRTASQILGDALGAPNDRRFL